MSFRTYYRPIPTFNSPQKYDRLPRPKQLAVAQPHLAQTYLKYGNSSTLVQVLEEYATLRFNRVQSGATFEMSRQRVTARNVVATVFPHAMNWEAKPQLHSHCVVMMD